MRADALLCLAFVSMTQAWTQSVVESQRILEPAKGWEAIEGTYQLTADSTVDRAGNVYFTDAHRNRIWRLDAGGKVSVWKENSGGSHGIAIGPDGKLYAGQHDRKRIVVYSQDGQEKVFAEDAQTHHLVVTDRNEIYFADGPHHTVWLLDARGQKRVATTEVDWPRGLRLSNAGSSLIVTDARNGKVWSFRINPDASLSDGSPLYRLEIPGERSEIDPGGITLDTEGLVYVATKIGVQVCDASGRVVEIIRPPGSDGLANVFFAGPDLHWLYVTDGARLFRRYANRRGVTPKSGGQ